MVPRFSVSGSGGSAAPRARGDGPASGDSAVALIYCSPRTRGWSQIWSRPGIPARLLPAHAGMVPRRAGPPGSAGPAPRARGDGPVICSTGTEYSVCSPRTRGWSYQELTAFRDTWLLPAHAGMVPTWYPVIGVESAAPRARGDGPLGTLAQGGSGDCSPRTRGWSRVHGDLAEAGGLLPAHAGMVPSTSPTSPHCSAAPRARGDGPPLDSGPLKSHLCSPRTRGWSQPESPLRTRPALLPAHAGMVPWR